MNCNVKWNGQKFKINEFKICVIFECEGSEIQYQQNIVWLFQKYKPIPRTNNIILIKVMSVTSGRHSERDTEQAYFLICSLFDH